MTAPPGQRLLLVHAHPDDETINQGATMAKYVAEGRGVTLITCTAGEMGGSHPRPGALGRRPRPTPLASTAAASWPRRWPKLGVADHRFLGGFGRYRDSGMKWHDDGHAVAADDIHLTTPSGTPT
ncbi:MAG: PIG-L family deacetylase [Nocardioides sp.]